MGENGRSVFYEFYLMFAEQMHCYFMRECGNDAELAERLSVARWVNFAARQPEDGGADREKVYGWLQTEARQRTELYRIQGDKKIQI